MKRTKVIYGFLILIVVTSYGILQADDHNLNKKKVIAEIEKEEFTFVFIGNEKDFW
jgi:hypothetical protein